MTPDETARVLAKCAAFDQRTVGRADVAAWAEALDDIAVDDGLAAVTRWYREHRDRVWPSDIRKLARDVAGERRPAIEPHEARALPGRFDLDDIRDERVRRGVAMCAAALSLTGRRRAALTKETPDA